MENFAKKQRELLAILSYAVLIFALVYFVVFQLLGKINETKDKIQEEQIKQDINKKHLEELPKFKEKYKMLENVDLDKYLIDKDNAVSLIEKLESLAGQSGNKINIAVQNQDANKNLAAAKAKKDATATLVNDLPSGNYLQFKITLSGDLNSIGKFIKSLENFEYNSDIIGMEIKSSKLAANTSQGNPFSQGQNQQVNADDGKLEAILDTVFYTK